MWFECSHESEAHDLYIYVLGLMIYCPQIYKDQDICIVRKGNWIGEDIQLILLRQLDR